MERTGMFVTAERTRPNYLVQRLISSELEQQWAQWLENVKNAEPEQARAARRFVMGLRDQLLDAVVGIEDKRELEAAAALMYTQLRAQAALLNTQMAYRMERGTPLSGVACKAALLSLLTAQVEAVLGRARQERLDEILSQPLDAPKGVPAAVISGEPEAHQLRRQLTILLTEDETVESLLSDEALVGSMEGLISTLRVQDLLVQALEEDRSVLEREVGCHSGRDVAARMAQMQQQIDTLQQENNALRAR